MDITIIVADADRECDGIRQRAVADLTALKTLHTLEQTSLDQLQTTQKLIDYEQQHTHKLIESVATNENTAATNDRQIYYEQMQTGRLHLWAKLLRFIYWMLAIVAIIYIWIGGTTNGSGNAAGHSSSAAGRSIQQKVIYTLLVCMYPFVIRHLTEWSTTWGGRIYSLLAIHFGGPT
jgi:hypothetical protein